VKAGFTASSVKSVEVFQTSREELREIQEVSKVKEPEVKPQDSALVQQIQKLEIQARESTLSDIKTYDPELYTKIQKSTGGDLASASLAELDQASMKVMIQQAPEVSARKKPSHKELENVEKDPYERYRAE
jgi:hypothetical protein